MFSGADYKIVAVLATGFFGDFFGAFLLHCCLVFVK
jgi:hypothetical protein